MRPDRLPWVLVAVLLVASVLSRGCDSGAVVEARARAELAEDSIATLGPLTELRLEAAARQDTVFVDVVREVTDTLEVLREVVVVVVDSLELHVDSIGAELLEELELVHAEETAAQERRYAAAVLLAQSWRSAAEALELELRQSQLRGDSWESAFRAQSRSKTGWKLAAVAGGLALLADRIVSRGP